MEYKQKYLKYKMKYLNAKSKNNTFTGGSTIESRLDNILQNNKLSLSNFKVCFNNYLESKPYTFKNTTTDPNKNLLLIIYAHWCSHCTSLINESGKDLVNSIESNNIKFLDGTLLDNEVKYKLNVNGYPTILKIDKSSTLDNIIKKEYIGDRTVNSLIQFLNN